MDGTAEKSRRFLAELDLELGATMADVEASYRILVRVWHPDKHQHSDALRQAAEKKLKRVNDAVEWFRDDPLRLRAAEADPGEAGARHASTGPESHPPPGQSDYARYTRSYQDGAAGRQTNRNRHDGGRSSHQQRASDGSGCVRGIAMAFGVLVGGFLLLASAAEGSLPILAFFALCIGGIYALGNILDGTWSDQNSQSKSSRETKD